jgi:hypothetical protein
MKSESRAEAGKKKMKRVIRLLSKAISLAEYYLSEDTDDIIDSIYSWTEEALDELKKLKRAKGK